MNLIPRKEITFETDLDPSEYLASLGLLLGTREGRGNLARGSSGYRFLGQVIGNRFRLYPARRSAARYGQRCDGSVEGIDARTQVRLRFSFHPFVSFGLAL